MAKTSKTNNGVAPNPRTKNTSNNREPSTAGAYATRLEFETHCRRVTLQLGGRQFHSELRTWNIFSPPIIHFTHPALACTHPFVFRGTGFYPGMSLGIRINNCQFSVAE